MMPSFDCGGDSCGRYSCYSCTSSEVREEYRRQVALLRDAESAKIATDKWLIAKKRCDVDPHLTIRDLRVALDTAIKERDTARAKVRLITQQYKPGWVDGLEAVARAAGYDPDKVRHEGVDPPTFIEDVIEDLRAENSRLRKECERLLESERLALETARETVTKKEENLSDYIWCAKHEWENVEPCWYCAKEGSVLENALVDNSLPPPPVRVPVASFGIPIRTYEAEYEVSKSSSNHCPDHGAGPDE